MRTDVVDPERYGRLRGDLAHRIAFELTTGARVRLPRMVLHRCDTPACFNPEHLFIGTAADNNRDMTAKGRNWRQSDDAKQRVGVAIRAAWASKTDAERREWIEKFRATRKSRHGY